MYLLSTSHLAATAQAQTSLSRLPEQVHLLLGLYDMQLLSRFQCGNGLLLLPSQQGIDRQVSRGHQLLQQSHSSIHLMPHSQEEGKLTPSSSQPGERGSHELMLPNVVSCAFKNSKNIQTPLQLHFYVSSDISRLLGFTQHYQMMSNQQIIVSFCCWIALRLDSHTGSACNRQ